MKINEADMKYLRLLAREYKTEQETEAEIINLTAIQNLPKGTEHFLSDIHGEAEAFSHILRNASGQIRMHIDEVLTELSEAERKTLATLIYYPEDKLDIIKETTANMGAFYKDTIHRLLRLIARVTAKYTRSYVRRQTPKAYSYMIEELLYGNPENNYRETIIESIIETGAADDVIIALCKMISRIAIFKLHVIGDVYDRGAGGDVVVDMLMNFHSLDIQWGNHDILWMGAAAGSKACIANVIRICTRYDNLHTLEVGYGISLRPLLTFAMKTYGNDSCEAFKGAASIKDAMHDTDIESLSKISKAIAIIQFKLEGEVIARHPYYEMESMRLLDKIDFKKKTVTVDGKEYPMKDCNLPTVDPADPYKLTEEEEAVIDRMQKAFLESELLQSHIRFLFAKGSLYKCVNGNLLFHGCMPVTPAGEIDSIQTSDGYKKGKEWFDYADQLVRRAFFSPAGSRIKQRGLDFCWFLWCGYKSPLFGKKKITTFERLFIDDESTWKEEKNPYYKHLDNEKMVREILKEFGCDEENGCIINGHIPVKKGTSPIRCNGRVFTIDGGFAKPYQKTTGIAGYSLIQNSHGFILTANEAFESRSKAILDEVDIHSTTITREDIDLVKERKYNKDTDDGAERQKQIEDLQMLLYAYRHGLIS
jgi:fructose-1,6-bisphosphatase-3